MRRRPSLLNSNEWALQSKAPELAARARLTAMKSRRDAMPVWGLMKTALTVR
jgi:hypothetical protein